MLIILLKAANKVSVILLAKPHRKNKLVTRANVMMWNFLSLAMFPVFEKFRPNYKINGLSEIFEINENNPIINYNSPTLIILILYYFKFITIIGMFNNDKFRFNWYNNSINFYNILFILLNGVLLILSIQRIISNFSHMSWIIFSLDLWLSCNFFFDIGNCI